MQAFDARPEAAEAIGVLFLVLGGGAAILAAPGAGTDALGAVGVALAFGFAILALVYALGPVCGAHFNPAVTLAFAATGHFPWRRVPTYVASQLVGAAAGALLLRALFGDVAPATTRLAAGTTPWQGFAVEALATALLALVIIGVATDRRAAPGAAGLAIGATVALASMAVGPLTGASLNPARTLGPALAAAAWDDLWLFVLGPVLGAVAGMAAYELLRPGRRPEARRGRPEAPLGALGPFPLRTEEA